MAILFNKNGKKFFKRHRIVIKVFEHAELYKVLNLSHELCTLISYDNK